MRHIEAVPVSGENLSEELGAFVDAHGQTLTRFAYLLTSGHGPAAEDLVQTVLVRLVARGLDGLSDPLAYTRRGIVNEHRSQVRHSQVHRQAVPRIANPEASIEPTTGTDDRLAVLDALELLTDRERAAVVLRYYEDLPDQQIADILGCSRPTVRSLVHRAIPKLQQVLADTYDAGFPGTAIPPAPSTKDRRDFDE